MTVELAEIMITAYIFLTYVTCFVVMVILILVKIFLLKFVVPLHNRDKKLPIIVAKTAWKMNTLIYTLYVYLNRPIMIQWKCRINSLSNLDGTS